MKNLIIKKILRVLYKYRIKFSVLAFVRSSINFILLLLIFIFVLVLNKEIADSGTFVDDQDQYDVCIVAIQFVNSTNTNLLSYVSFLTGSFNATSKYEMNLYSTLNASSLFSDEQIKHIDTRLLGFLDFKNNFYDESSCRMLCGYKYKISNKDVKNDIIFFQKNKFADFSRVSSKCLCLESKLSYNMKKYFESYKNCDMISKVPCVFSNYFDRFLGFSVKKFEERKTNEEKFIKVFKISKKECFNKSLDIIKEFQAKVTHKSFKKGYIVAFGFTKTFSGLCLDSTEICVFITEICNDNVKVEIISCNNLLASKFSVGFFNMFT
ncbi:MAG: hypothetical protein LBS47_01465 [Endomicrobium sp.]|jgi:hypothetical protein|nr:hypothetical protein [Endomicrobium sp.]